MFNEGNKTIFADIEQNISDFILISSHMPLRNIYIISTNVKNNLCVIFIHEVKINLKSSYDTIYRNTRTQILNIHNNIYMKLYQTVQIKKPV